MIKLLIKYRIPLVILAAFFIMTSIMAVLGFIVWSIGYFLSYGLECPELNIGYLESSAIGAVVGFVGAFIFSALSNKDRHKSKRLPD